MGAEAAPKVLGAASPVPEAGSRLWPCCGGAAITNMLVPCSIMQLVDAIDDAIERILAVPGCDSLDVDGVNALVDLLGVLDDAAIDPNGGGGRLRVIEGGLKLAA